MKLTSSGIGLFILAWLLLYSIWAQINRDNGEGLLDTERIVISFAHVQLESGMREAYNALIADYEALHPNVSVTQIPVPLRVWRFWMESRLAGGMAPDLMQLVDNDPNPIQRNFHPIDEWVEEPNPYNAGTDLEGIPWKDTLVVNLDAPPAYWPEYLSYYSVPLTVFTFRVLYNKPLLEEISGSSEFPEDFASFLELCDKVNAIASKENRTLYPIAGSKYNAPFFNIALVRSQTQKLYRQVDLTRELDNNFDVAMSGYLWGLWNLRDPEIRSGLELVQRFGRYFQPGFNQANREDALFYFLQERALMNVAGSFELAGIREDASFDIGVAQIPMPDSGHPSYGRYTLGPVSERQASLRSGFAVTKQSRHREQAIDFLRFLSSQEAHRKFVAISRWVPVVQGVEVPEDTRIFQPIQSGYHQGFAVGNGVETRRLRDVSQNLLFEENGIERFLDKVEPVYAEHEVLDMAKEVRESLNNASSWDGVIAARKIAGEFSSPDKTAGQKLSKALESQARLERVYHRVQYETWRFRKYGIPESPIPAYVNRGESEE